MKIDTPVFHIVRQKNGTFNFSDLIDKSIANPSSEPLGESDQASSKKIFGFTIENFNLINGRIIFDDKIVDTEHKIEKLALSIPFISSKEKYIHTPAKVNTDFILNQTRFNIKITSIPFAKEMATKVVLKTDDINGLHYLSYLPVPDTIFIKDIDLNLDLDFEFKKMEQESSLVLQGEIQAKNADILSPNKNEILKISFLSLNVLPSDLIKKQIHLSKSDMGALHLNINRDKNGKINLLNLLEKTRNLNESKTEKEMTNSPGPSFLFTLDEFEMKTGTIAFSDNANQDAFNTVVSPIYLRLRDIKFDKQISGSYTINLKTESNETASLDGKFNTGPPSLSTDLTLKQMSLGKYASYYNKYLNGVVNSGKLNLITKIEIDKKQNLFDLQMKIKELIVQSLTVVDQSSKDEVINIPVFKITNADIKVLDRKVTTESIMSQGGKIFINRLKNGRITLLESFKPYQNETHTANKTIETQTETKLPDQNNSDWNVSAGLIDITNYAVSFNDAAPTDKVSLDLSDIEFKGLDLKNYGEEKSKIAMMMKWNEAGKIQMNGDAIVLLAVCVSFW